MRRHPRGNALAEDHYTLGECPTPPNPPFRLGEVLPILSIAMFRPFRPAAALLVLLSAPWLLHGQTDSSLWRFVHPNAKALISINWKLLRQSQTGSIAREKWLSSGPGAAIPGLQFLDDVDRFLISSSGHLASDEASDSPFLIAVSGRFDLAKVRSFLTSQGIKPQQFNSFQVYRPQGRGAKDTGVVLLDAQTVLIGDVRSVFACLERNAFPQPAPAPNSIVARAAEMEANYDVWLLADGLESLASGKLTDMFGDDQISSEARGFQAGISLRAGLTAEVALQFETEEAAQKLATELTKFLKLSIKDRTGEPAFAELGKKLNIVAEGAVAKINLHLTQQELDKNAKLMGAPRKMQGTVAVRGIVSSTPTEPPPAPPRPERQVIRIEGLDDGIREIPLK